MDLIPRILVHRDERHLTGRDWYHSVNSLSGTDNSRIQAVEIIGIAVSPAQHPPRMADTRAEFEKKVDDVATDVRWFNNPIVLSDGS